MSPEIKTQKGSKEFLTNILFEGDTDSTEIAKEMKQEVTSDLTGILLPDAWTGDGKISGFALCTDDEQKYVLKCSDGIDKLMAVLRQNIKVSGILMEKEGERSILVTSLQSLPLREDI